MCYNDLYNTAETNYSNGEFLTALKLFEKAYILNPSNSVLNYIGCCRLSINNLNYAKKTFELLIATTYWEVPWYNLGRTYLMQEDYSEALRCFNEAIDINPYNDDCYFYLGVYYEKTNKFKLAIECYNKAIMLCNNNYDKAMYCTNSGNCYYCLNDLKNANNCYNKAIELCSDYEDAYINKRRLCHSLKNKGTNYDK